MHSFSSSARFQTRLQHDVDEQLPTPSTSSQCPSPSIESEPSSSALQKALPSEMLGEVLYLSHFLPPKGEVKMATYITVKNIFTNKAENINLSLNGQVLTLASLEHAFPGGYGLIYKDPNPATTEPRNVAMDLNEQFFTPPEDGWQQNERIYTVKFRPGMPFQIRGGVVESDPKIPLSTAQEFMFYRKRQRGRKTTLSNVIGISSKLAITHAHVENLNLNENAVIDVYSFDGREIKAKVIRTEETVKVINSDGQQVDEEIFYDLLILQAIGKDYFLKDVDSPEEVLDTNLYNSQKYTMFTFGGCELKHKQISELEGSVFSNVVSRRGFYTGAHSQWLDDSGGACIARSSQKLIGMAIGFLHSTQKKTNIKADEVEVHGSGQRAVILSSRKILSLIEKKNLLPSPAVAYDPYATSIRPI